MADKSDFSTLIELVTRVSDAVSTAKADVSGIRSALELLKSELTGKIAPLVDHVSRLERTNDLLEARVRALEDKAARHNPNESETRIRTLENGHTSLSTKITLYAAIASAGVAIVVTLISRGLGLR